jgi:hypothetical protein
MSLSNPDASITLENKVDAFVDDSYLMAASSNHIDPAQAAVRHLKQVSQMWERGLFSTGGAINPEEFLGAHVLEMAERGCPVTSSIPT